MSTLVSPCINVCRMNGALGLCEGCARTINEIAAWGQMDPAGKQLVWRALPERQARLRSLGIELPQRSEVRS
jgi:uncharacterized protein